MVVSWREVRWIWWMRQNFLALFIQLLKRWLCEVWSGIVLRKKQALSLINAFCRCCSFQCISSISWSYFSDAMVSLGFRKLEWIRLAADHQTATMTFFWCKFRFRKCFGASWYNHWADPSLNCHLNSTFIICPNPIEKCFFFLVLIIFWWISWGFLHIGLYCLQTS